MIPLYDDLPRISFPIMNVLLIAANIVVFIHELSLGRHQTEAFMMMYGMVPSHVGMALQSGTGLGLALKPLFTSMFVHSGWLHIIGNMWFLWIFGDNTEDALGHFGYLIFYLGCGLAGGVTHVIANWGSNLPAVGASGAIAGVMGAYIILYPRARILTLIVLVVFFFTVRLPAVVVIGVWFAIQFFSGIGSLGMAQAGGVAFWAHIGGFLAGAIVGLIAKASLSSA
ncbi:MAG TPA: rhomboid family intramembrane serine protease [Candidatus Acidoferrum sp.]|nr:rhomboid family intramembrane serine protease [Candidatus Acidoferrum sp.]